MTKFSIIVAAALAAPITVDAATLLTVDLNTANKVTITATDGASSSTVSGSVFTGVYLDSFFNSIGFASAFLDSGNLTSFLNPSNNSPDLFRLAGTDPGLNIYNFTNDITADFISGILAFTGSATWSVGNLEYATLLAGNFSGDLYFPADTQDDLSNATLIGQWERVRTEDPTSPVPLPAAGWMLGAALLGFGAVSRRKKKT